MTQLSNIYTDPKKGTKSDPR